MLSNPARKGQNLKSLFAPVVYQIRSAYMFLKLLFPEELHYYLLVTINRLCETGISK